MKEGFSKLKLKCFNFSFVRFELFRNSLDLVLILFSHFRFRETKIIIFV